MADERRTELTPSYPGGGRATLAGLRPKATVPLGGEKPRDFRGGLAKLVSYLGRHRRRLTVVAMLSVASTVLTLYAPLLLGRATDLIFDCAMARLAGAEGPTMDYAGIGRICLTLLVLYLVSSGFTYLRGYVVAGVSQEVVFDLRREASEKIDRLPLSYFDSRSVGEVLSRMVNDVDLISSSLQESVTQSIQAVVTLVGVLVMMLYISGPLTLLVIVTLPLSAVVTATITKRSRRYFRAQQRRLGDMNAHIEEMYSGHVVVRAFNQEERSIEEFRSANDDLYRYGWRAQFVSGVVRPAMSLVSNLRYVVVAVGGGILVVRGALTVGSIQAFIKYNRQFGQPITQISNITNVIQATVAAAERVFELLEATEEDPGIPLGSTEPVRGAIEFDRVSFGYVPERTIVDDVSFSVEPGSKVAVVGPTGAGKTTLVNLLMRFYDVDAGTIRLDGHDVAAMGRDELRSAFGMVLQDTWLFNGTIADNIRYGAEHATDDEVRRAAEVAHVDHFVRTLPDGYDTVINEEASNISTGQKQLITIARAVLSDPSILILDEATSSIDTRTELLVQSAMKRIMQGRTSFVIAHRLSTIQDADLILVMKAGDIVEQGDHASLLAAEGLYAELYRSQFVRDVA